MPMTEEERRKTIIYNFSIATNDGALFERLIELASRNGMKRAENIEPEEIIGTNPTEITKDYGYAARFLGNDSAHPTLQQVWEFAGDLKDRSVQVRRPSCASPSGNYPMVAIIS